VVKPQVTADHAERNLRPGKIFRINVAVLLREVMSWVLFYWLYDGVPPPVLPVPPGPDSMEAPLPPDLWMPTANLVGLLHFTNDEAFDYLLQRDFKFSLHPLETHYYAPTYWARCRPVQLLRPVLKKLADSRSSALRSAYLFLVWNQVPISRKKGLFARRGVDSCPLCGLSDWLNDVIL
jgi:hypothetical protein